MGVISRRLFFATLATAVLAAPVCGADPADDGGPSTGPAAGVADPLVECARCGTPVRPGSACSLCDAPLQTAPPSPLAEAQPCPRCHSPVAAGAVCDSCSSLPGALPAGSLPALRGEPFFRPLGGLALGGGVNLSERRRPGFRSDVRATELRLTLDLRAHLKTAPSLALVLRYELGLGLDGIESSRFTGGANQHNDVEWTRHLIDAGLGFPIELRAAATRLTPALLFSVELQGVTRSGFREGGAAVLLSDLDGRSRSSFDQDRVAYAPTVGLFLNREPDDDPLELSAWALYSFAPDVRIENDLLGVFQTSGSIWRAGVGARYRVSERVYLGAALEYRGQLFRATSVKTRAGAAFQVAAQIPEVVEHAASLGATCEVRF